MKLTIEQVRHVARLARLELSPAEAERYREQLSVVLDAVDQLNEVDVTGVPPMSHVAAASGVIRADEPGPPLTSAQAFSNAPAKADGNFVIPKVIE